MKSFALSLMTLFVLLLAGCSGKDGGSRVSDLDMKSTVLAHINYYDQKRKAPTKAEDLAQLMDKSEAHVVTMMKSGDIVVQWDVSVADLMTAPGGPKEYVLAYEKDAPTKGGFVATGDAGVKKVTAEEFKALKLAKKSDK
jgi:hypothetical protein